MTYTTMQSTRPFLFFMLLFITGLQQSAWSDEYPSPPSADAAAVSPDGKTLVFESDNMTRKTTLWTAHRDGSHPRPLLNWPDSTQTNPDWSPDGEYIVFSSNRDDSRSRDIWRVNADGSNPIKLTAEGDNPRYSPDGTKILFTTDRTIYPGLWYMSIDGSDQRPTRLPAEITSDLSWSPDGNALVYSKCAGIPKSGSWQDMECHLFTYRLDTGAIKQLTFGKVDDSSPDWGALGIVFTSNRSAKDGLFIVEESGNNLRQMMTNNGLNLNPRWDHATDTIVYSKATQYENNIWSTDIHGNETQLTHFGFTNRPPIAHAGSDQIVRLNSWVTLDASGSKDPDNGPSALKYLWGQTTGMELNLSSPLVVKPNFQASAKGSYTFILVVNDGFNVSDLLTASISDIRKSRR